ncbi:MAG TPA: hypothetical protein VJ249_11065 [Candidatus Bathyarchaeia archaeon]|nr:hypothetical protein [Candidatus Bathyarchaeia archaeon]
MSVQKVQDFSYGLTFLILGFGGLFCSKCIVIIFEFVDFFNIVPPCCDFVEVETSPGCVCGFSVKELQASRLQPS